MTPAAIPTSGILLIMRFEGYHRRLPDGRAAAYPDVIRGWKVPTIGYGTTVYPNGHLVQPGDIISPEYAKDCLLWDIEHRCTPALQRIPTWPQMLAHQRGALYSFAYNLGPNFYGKRKFASITRVCDTPERWADSAWIRAQFVKYCNPGTPAEPGLLRRREAEARLFLGMEGEKTAGC